MPTLDSFAMLVPFPGSGEYFRMLEDIHSSLLSAIECEQKSRVKHILQAYPGMVNRADFHGNTPLSNATFYNHLDICKILFEYKADPNKGNRINITPLHIAKTDSMMTLLLDAGANINATSANGHTPLSSAMYKYEFEKVRFLLKRGAYIDQDILDEFEKKSTFSMFVIHEVNVRHRELIKNMVLPFLSNKKFVEEQEVKQQKFVLEEKEEKEEVAIPVEVECFICMESFNASIKTIVQKIPCFNGDALKHQDEFLCISCCNQIRKKDNKCPLCRAELMKK